MKKVILYSVFILFSAVQGLFGVTYFDRQWAHIEANKRNWGKGAYGLVCKDFIKIFENKLRGFNDTVSQENIDELVAMVGEIVTKVYSNRGDEVYKQLPNELAKRSIEKITNYLDPSYEQSCTREDRARIIAQEVDFVQVCFHWISFSFCLFDIFLNDPELGKNEAGCALIQEYAIPYDASSLINNKFASIKIGDVLPNFEKYFGDDERLYSLEKMPASIKSVGSYIGFSYHVIYASGNKKLENQFDPFFESFIARCFLKDVLESWSTTKKVVVGCSVVAIVVTILFCGYKYYVTIPVAAT